MEPWAEFNTCEPIHKKQKKVQDLLLKTNVRGRGADVDELTESCSRARRGLEAVCPLFQSETAPGLLSLLCSARIPRPSSSQGHRPPWEPVLFPQVPHGAPLWRPQAGGGPSPATPRPTPRMPPQLLRVPGLLLWAWPGHCPLSAMTLEAITITACYTCGSHTVHEQVRSEPSPSTPSL